MFPQPPKHFTILLSFSCSGFSLPCPTHSHLIPIHIGGLGLNGVSSTRPPPTFQLEEMHSYSDLLLQGRVCLSYNYYSFIPCAALSSCSVSPYTLLATGNRFYGFFLLILKAINKNPYHLFIFSVQYILDK